MKEINKIYLAGPDVFRDNANHYFEGMKLLCTGYHQIGLSPFDSEASAEATSLEIFKANVKLINECDIVVANLEPFRGPHVDDGTAWEIGYAHSKGKAIYGYSRLSRVSLKSIVKSIDYHLFESKFHHIEDFNLPVNLMLAHAIEVSGGKIYETFVECLQDIIKHG